MPDETILVLDIGSSAVKAVLLARGGGVASQAEAGYPSASPQPGWFEQAPAAWAAAIAQAIGRLGDLGGVARVALTGTMQNLIALGADGTPLGPAILYSDGRAAPRLPGFTAEMARIGAAARLGNQIDPLMCSAKLDWLRAESPDTFAAAAMFHAGAKDVCAFLLTGAHVTDATSASTTGLMDLATRDWDAAILATLALSRDRLPRILPADALIGTVTPRAAARFGLPAGVPVMNGSGDAGASTIGAGVERASEAYVYLGTTGWVARCAPAQFPRAPLAIYTLAHPLPGLLIEIAPILSAGDCVAWATELFGAADDSEPGSEPPLFLPYLKGERSPFHDAAVRGAFLGLDRGHTRASLRQAVLEGVALAIRHNLAELGGVAGTLAALGGGAANPAWMQTLADIAGFPVAVPALPVAATALGAGVLAARTLGWPPPAAPQPALFQPRPAAAARAARLLSRYMAASDFLRAWARIEPD